MFGGDWCGWCHKLHDLFASNPEIRKTLSYEYVLVTIDTESPNAAELLKTCKAALSKDELQKGVGYPFLAVLDAEGKVVTAQRTDPLEEGDHHDPKRVQEFLNGWKVPPKDAKLVLEEALSRASSDDKRVLLTFGAPWCGWCHKLHDWLAQPEIAAILDRDFVIAQIDVDRMTGGKDVQKHYQPATSAGIPWFAILDAKGKSLVDLRRARRQHRLSGPAPGDRAFPVDGQGTRPPHRRPPVGSAPEIPGRGRRTDQASVGPVNRIRRVGGVEHRSAQPTVRAGKSGIRTDVSALREGGEGRLATVMDLHDLVEPDDIRPDAHVRIDAAELDRPLPGLGLFHHLEESRVSHAAQVAGPAQVHQERLSRTLADDRDQLGAEPRARSGPCTSRDGPAPLAPAAR